MKISHIKPFLIIILVFNYNLFAQNWTLVPSKSFEFDNFSKPFSDDFIFNLGYPDDYAQSMCGGSAPTAVVHSWTGELNSLGPNNISYYTASTGENCARIKIEKIDHYPYPGCYLQQTWRTGMLYTKSSYQYRYGKFEIRCKVPKGKGFWPSFWAYGGSPPDEIDILETINQQSNSANYAEFNYHTPYNDITTFDHGGGGQSTLAIDLSTAFHVFSAEWTPEHIIYRIDDKIFFEFLKYNSPDPSVFPSQFVRLLASVSVAKSRYNKDNVWEERGPDSNTPTLTYMDIDYIRYYTENCQSHIYCDSDNNNITNFKGYELQFAVPKDINPDGVVAYPTADINLNTINGTWSVDVPSFEYTCDKTVSLNSTAKAEKSIIFNPGFITTTGVTFTADIIPCASQLIVDNNDNNAVNHQSQIAGSIESISIYPNPNKGSFTLNINIPKDIFSVNNIPQQQKYYKVIITDILGKQIYYEVLNINFSNINMDQRDNGIYFIMVKDNEDQVIGYKKLIVQ